MTQHYKLADQVILEAFEQDGVIIHLGTEAIFSLNDTGVAVIQRLVQGMSIDEAITSLQDSYDIDAERLRTEVEQLVNELLTSHLLVAA